MDEHEQSATNDNEKSSRHELASKSESLNRRKKRQKWPGPTFARGSCACDKGGKTPTLPAGSGHTSYEQRPAFWAAVLQHDRGFYQGLHRTLCFSPRTGSACRNEFIVARAYFCPCLQFEVSLFSSTSAQGNASINRKRGKHTRNDPPHPTSSKVSRTQGHNEPAAKVHPRYAATHYVLHSWHLSNLSPLLLPRVLLCRAVPRRTCFGCVRYCALCWLCWEAHVNSSAAAHC